MIICSYRDVNLYITLGGTEIGESASAEGAKLRLPNARSSSRLGGLWSVVKSPVGSGAELQKPTRFLNILCQNGVHFWDIVNVIFFSNQVEKDENERNFY